MEISKEGVEFKEYLFTKFNPETMVFLRWLNSFEYIFEMSNAGDDEKVKCLLNMIDPLVFEKIKQKLSTSQFFDLSYDEIITVLEDTFSEFKGKMALKCRYLFRHQFPYESIEHYALGLRKLYVKCTPYFKNLAPIRDRFIEGLLDERTKILLKNSENMSLNTTIFIAKKCELANRQK